MFVHSIYNGCLSAPPHSIGYFVIPLTVVGMLAEEETVQNILSDVTLYPNPANNTMYIMPETKDGNDASQKFTVCIYTAQGNPIFENQYSAGEKIEIAMLPGGYYLVAIKAANYQHFYKPLIKIQ